MVHRRLTITNAYSSHDKNEEGTVPSKQSSISSIVSHNDNNGDRSNNTIHNFGNLFGISSTSTIILPMAYRDFVMLLQFDSSSEETIYQEVWRMAIENHIIYIIITGGLSAVVAVAFPFLIY